MSGLHRASKSSAALLSLHRQGGWGGRAQGPTRMKHYTDLLFLRIVNARFTLIFKSTVIFRKFT